MRCTLAQLNPTIGDIDGNAAQIEAAIASATSAGSDLVVTSELAMLGYPPRDLLLRDGVAKRCLAEVERIARRCTSLAALVGFPQPWPNGPRPYRNAVAFCRHGAVEAVYAKRLLPTYDVFDEDRYFTPGDRPLVVDVGGERVGVLVCEDLWKADDAGAPRGYLSDPVGETLAAGATTLAILSASPFVVGKDAKHRQRLLELARRGVRVVAVNQAGGNDDLVFDGRSRAYATGGPLVARLAPFDADVRTASLDGAAVDEPATDPLDEIVAALVTGIRDYFRKTGHTHAILGLSGGIDSALVATLATMALGTKVRGVLMPSRFSSQGSIDDARESVRRLKLFDSIAPIRAAHEIVSASLAESFGPIDGVADENMQSRLRGLFLMAASNKFGGLVLSTGNKSELAVGYATLYGDMAGALAPIGDVLKTTVWDIARHLNQHHRRYGFDEEPIPRSSIEKPPSAELRPDQTDQDTLPPYEQLDAIVEARIEREQSVESIVASTSLDPAVVRRWCRAIDLAQYKRDQAAIILKISPRCFGRGRPMPIASRGD
ncbi:MAG: NAD+ synthase [Phycisphaerales bacterium]